MKCKYQVIALQVFALGLMASVASAQSWTNRFDVSEDGFAQAVAIAMDSAGNAFVTGSATGVSNNPDYATVAYSSSGTALWTNLYNGPANDIDSAAAIAVGSNGMVYVTGFSTGLIGGRDFATVAYANSGKPLWTNRYNGLANGDDYAVGVAIGSKNQIIVVGNATSTNGRGTYDLVTVAYSSAGLPQWTNRYSGAEQFINGARPIVVDAVGNVYVTGGTTASTAAGFVTIAYSGSGKGLWTNYYRGTQNTDTALVIDSSDAVCLTGNSTQGYTTVTYSSKGKAQWTNIYSGPDGSDQVTALAADTRGSVYVTGASSPGAPHPNDDDYATVAYANSGKSVWTNRYRGPSGGFNQATAITTDSGGNVYVTGYSPDSRGNFGYATIAYMNSGFPLWTNRFDTITNGNNEAVAIAVDRAGNVFVTGNSLNTNGAFGYATIKYTPPLLIIANNTNFGFNGAHFGFDIYGPANFSALVEGSPDFQTWTHLQTNSLANGTTHFSDPTAATAVRFYRAALYP